MTAPSQIPRGFPIQSSDEIVALMERHEDDWDETAFNGWGTAACGRWGRYIWQWNNDGSTPEHHGHTEATPEAASEFVREWAAQYTDGFVYDERADR